VKLGGWSRIGLLASGVWLIGCAVSGRTSEPLRYLAAHFEVVFTRLSANVPPDHSLPYTDPTAAQNFRPWEHLKGAELRYSDRFVEANSVRDVEYIRDQLAVERRILGRVTEDRALGDAMFCVGPILAGWLLGWVILYPGRRLAAILMRWIADGFRSN
jgi:hypothetical protein